MRATTRLSRRLKTGNPALTVECQPPRGAAPADVKRMASYFPDCVDAVVVVDNHHHVHSSALACAALLKSERTEILLSMVTRDRNRIALESDVLGAASLGIEGFLCLSGAHQSLGVGPSASGVYDLDSCQLTLALARMADEGLDFSGRPLESSPHLFIAATAHPDLAPIELSLLGVRKKIAAGVDVLFTDAVRDLSSFERWMSALCAAGYQQQVAVIASVRPSELHLVERLRRIDGLRGIHLLSGGSELHVGEFLQKAGLA